MQAKKVFLLVCEGFLLPWLAFAPAPSNAGEDGSVAGSTNLFAAAVVSEQRYVVVGDRGRIFLSTDGAKTWRPIKATTTQPLVSVCFPDDHHGWMCGQDGVILHSPDGGATWEAQSSGVDSYLMAIDFADRTKGCAVGTDSTILITSDSGTTWRKAAIKFPGPDVTEDSGFTEELNLFAVAMIDDEHIGIAGERGRIFITEDAGENWIEGRSPLYDKETKQGRILYSLSYDHGTLYAVGIDSTYVYSKDYGKTWTLAQTGFTEPELYCVSVVGGTGLAAGSGGNIIQTSDGGHTWKVVDVPEKVTQYWLSGIALRRGPSGMVSGLIVGQNGTIGHFVDGNVSWQ